MRGECWLAGVSLWWLAGTCLMVAAGGQQTGATTAEPQPRPTTGWQQEEDGDDTEATTIGAGTEPDVEVGAGRDQKQPDQQQQRRRNSGRRNRTRDRDSQKSDEADRVRERMSRGLVPQLLPNYTAPSLPPAGNVSCEFAFMACAYRDGCGLALKQYDLTCNDMVTGVTDICSRACQHALIALLSTPEGERLMQCRCSDEACTVKKRRVEPCRSAVTWQNAPNTLVSCSAATWICLADPLCATALDYYNRNCKAMFKGRKCSRRCHNSLDILLRQKAANKLATCVCDGTEDFDCAVIRENTDVLCFGKGKEVVSSSDADGNRHPGDDDATANEIDVDGGQGQTSGATDGHRPPSGRLTLAVLTVLVTYLIPETMNSLRQLLQSINVQRVET